MLLTDPQDPLSRSLEAFFQEHQIQLVEAATWVKNGTTAVHLVVYAPGLGIDDLSRVHRLLIPHLESVLGTDDLSVELGTPGLDRQLKYRRELEWYLNRRVRVLIAGESEWHEGLIHDADRDRIILATPTGEETVPIDTISKAKLHDL